MNDTQITLTGWVGTPVQLREAGGVAVANLRVACTPRRFDRKADAWVDADTQWYAVTAWRQLAENAAASLETGDPVVLHGRMVAEKWTNSGGIEVTSMKIEASFIGHDLTRGVSRFMRTPRADGSADHGADPGTDHGVDHGGGPADVAGVATGERDATPEGDVAPAA